MVVNADMTIYNKYFSSGMEKYQRTQILNVKWENRKAANVLSSGLLSADSVAVYIPFANNADYVKPKAFQTLITKTGKWTLQEGDYIVKGLVLDEIVAAVIDPPSSAFTITSLKAKYDDVVMIKSVDTLDAGSSNIQHWQLGAS